MERGDEERCEKHGYRENTDLGCDGMDTQIHFGMRFVEAEEVRLLVL